MLVPSPSYRLDPGLHQRPQPAQEPLQHVLERLAYSLEVCGVAALEVLSECVQVVNDTVGKGIRPDWFLVFKYLHAHFKPASLRALQDLPALATFVVLVELTDPLASLPERRHITNQFLELHWWVFQGLLLRHRTEMDGVRKPHPLSQPTEGRLAGHNRRLAPLVPRSTNRDPQPKRSVLLANRPQRKPSALPPHVFPLLEEEAREAAREAAQSPSKVSSSRPSVLSSSRHNTLSSSRPSALPVSRLAPRTQSVPDSPPARLPQRPGDAVHRLRQLTPPKRLPKRPSPPPLDLLQVPLAPPTSNRTCHVFVPSDLDNVLVAYSTSTMLTVEVGVLEAEAVPPQRAAPRRPPGADVLLQPLRIYKDSAIDPKSPSAASFLSIYSTRVATPQRREDLLLVLGLAPTPKTAATATPESRRTPLPQPLHTTPDTLKPSRSMANRLRQRLLGS